MQGVGIEIMPIGNLLAQSIAVAANGLRQEDVNQASKDLIGALSRTGHDTDLMYRHVPITEHAFSEQTERDLAKARSFINAVADPSLYTILTLACVSILEEVSYTRKDGQFLRWDPSIRARRKTQTA